MTLCTLLLWAKARLPVGRGRTLAVGALSGALVSSTGTIALPLVILLQSKGHSPMLFRGPIQALFCLQAVAAVTGLAAVGRVSWLTLLLVVICRCLLLS